MPAAEIVSNSEPDSCILLTFKTFVDILQPVVSSVAAVLAHPYRPEREVEVVTDDYDILNGYLLLLHPVPYGLAAQIHVG